jgi:GNAT superfamily N-acetyltransferase
MMAGLPKAEDDVSKTPTREPETPHVHAERRPAGLTARTVELRCTRLDLYDGDLKVAAAQVHAASDTVLEIVDVFVEPDLRGRGYGRAVIERVLEYARSQGYAEVCAHTSPRNAPAFHLFQQFGFHACEEEVHLERDL